MASGTNSSHAARFHSRTNPRISAVDPIFATILVGEEKKRFVLHEAVLIHYSGLFRAAVTGRFAEAESKTVTLRDESPGTVELIIHRLYYQRLPDKEKNDNPELLHLSFDADNQLHLYDALIRLYVFGDKYEVAELGRINIKHIFKAVNASCLLLPGMENVEYAFTHLSPTSPMCHLIIDLHCQREVVDSNSVKYTNLAFLQAIWQRYVHFHQSDDVDIDADLILCDYHEHDTEEERHTCRRQS